MRAAEQDRPDVTRKRRLWQARQRFMDAARLVFLDETGTATDMARRYGRSPLGERLAAPGPHGHWRTTSFIAGLRQSGIVAPRVLELERELLNQSRLALGAPAVELTPGLLSAAGADRLLACLHRPGTATKLDRAKCHDQWLGRRQPELATKGLGRRQCSPEHT